MEIAALVVSAVAAAVALAGLGFTEVGTRRLAAIDPHAFYLIYPGVPASDVDPGQFRDYLNQERANTRKVMWGARIQLLAVALQLASAVLLTAAAV